MHKWLWGVSCSQEQFITLHFCLFVCFHIILSQQTSLGVYIKLAFSALLHLLYHNQVIFISHRAKHAGRPNVHNGVDLLLLYLADVWQESQSISDYISFCFIVDYSHDRLLLGYHSVFESSFQTRILSGLHKVNTPLQVCVQPCCWVNLQTWSLSL